MMIKHQNCAQFDTNPHGDHRVNGDLNDNSPQSFFVTIFFCMSFVWEPLKKKIKGKDRCFVYSWQPELLLDTASRMARKAFSWHGVQHSCSNGDSPGAAATSDVSSGTTRAPEAWHQGNRLPVSCWFEIPNILVASIIYHVSYHISCIIYTIMYTIQYINNKEQKIYNII